MNRQSAIGNRQFLTGFPGFIAGKLVERLVKEDVQFFLLVQSVFLEKARKQIKEIVSECGVAADRFQIIEGDITQPNLGMSVLDYERTKEETTSIFHLAAIYDLAVTRDVGMHVNVEGTRNVNAFAQAVKNLHRYNYISTCYVAGKRKGLIKETELEHDKGFRNFYEETKYLAEIEVEKLKPELPITIHRPAVVVGDSKTGETAKYDGIYYVIHYLRRMPGLLPLFNIGNKDVRLNLVPIDFVCDAMAALAKDENAVGKTFHIADPSPLTTEDICNAIGQSLSGKKSIITIPAKIVNFTLMTPISPTITGLPHVGVPYFFLQQTYDTTQLQQFLEPHGIHCPSFASYIDNLIAFVKEHPKI
jgi:nucleoside-diphosphate-sugar epimerase